MATVTRMPEPAANTPEATLVEWLVKEGATVSVGDAIATVETAKATVDIESEVAGVVLRLVVQEGSDVAVGSPIIVIGAAGEPVDEAMLGTDAPEQAAPPVEAAPPVASAPPPERARAAGGRIFASPLARKLAREADLELSQITGTGPHGRIVRRDIVRATAAKAAERNAPAPPSTAVSTDEGWTDVPHTKLRRAIATRLAESKRTAPHFYVEGMAKVDELLALRARLNESTGQRISVNDLIVKAVARAHVAVPRMNVIWTDDAVREFDHVDVAVAIATPQGLVTPVVRRADSLGLGALAATTRDYAARARDGKLAPAELDGGSVTVSNLGMFGTRAFTAIINPPHASILAVGAAIESPVAVDGRLAVARTMTFTLSVDHRPVDGVVAAEWMREFVNLLEDPLRLLV
jgi:pyruvate dehydrogenase E2 component (dihydrolipoamide acetyltransferase)